MGFPDHIRDFSMTKISTQNRLKAIQILQLENKEAIEFISAKYKSHDNLVSDESFEAGKIHEVASYYFARRSSKELRLAVGMYGSHITTLRKLFFSGSATERLAVLSNPLVGPRHTDTHSTTPVFSTGEANLILENSESRPREFTVFARNPYLNRGWLSDKVSHYLKKKQFEDNGIRQLVFHLGSNPLVFRERDQVYLDGVADYFYDKLNLDLLKYLQEVPATNEWAEALSNLLKNIYIPFVPEFDKDLIKYWQETDRDGKRAYYKYLLRMLITQRLIVEDHRKEQRERYPVDHPDEAVRNALYRCLPPAELLNKVPHRIGFSYPSSFNVREEELNADQDEILAICKGYHERDGSLFIIAILENKHFWKSESSRNFLEALALLFDDDSLGFTNGFRSVQSRLQKTRPSLFKDDQSVSDLQEADQNEAITQICSNIKSITDEINKLSEALDSKIDLSQLKHTVSQIADDHSESLYNLTRMDQEKSQEEVMGLVFEIKAQLKSHSRLLLFLSSVLAIIVLINLFF